MVLLVVMIGAAALLTWIVPAGEFGRVTDPVTGRTVAVAGSYTPVGQAPVGAFEAIVAIPRGFIAGADVIASVLLVGAAFYLLDKIGTLGRILGSLVQKLGDRQQLAIPILVLFFGSMGALENMQEEIIAMVPVLLVLARRIRVDAVTIVAASAGAAMVGSAFGPTNPFQAGIALTLAELPVLQGGGLRLIMWVTGLICWTLWILRHVRVSTSTARVKEEVTPESATGRDFAGMAFVLLPLACYVYGALRWEWGFNELSGAFLAGAFLTGIVNRLGATRTATLLLEGAQALLPAALMVGLARSISLVLADGHVIDSILHAMVTPLSQVSPHIAALAMVPVQAVIHIPVSSVSGQAALTMPIMAPLTDLLGLSRQVAVLAFQTGGGLMELLTPTNGALLAVLLSAEVPFQRWLRFALGGWALLTVIGVLGIFAAIALHI